MPAPDERPHRDPVRLSQLFRLDAAATSSGALDLVVGVTVVVVAAVGLPGQEPWARWVLAVLGDVTALVGVVKLAGVRRLRAVAA